MTEKQYPELPEPTAWRTYDNLLKRARYNAMPITSMQPGIYSHTRMFTEDQMYAYVDADREMRAAQAAPQPVEHPWVASDTMRADLIADLHDVFDTSGSETPQIVHDVIEYANSWLQVYIQKKAESPTQPAAPASQDADDAARLDWLTFNLSGAALRAIGVEWPERGDARKAIDAARAKQEGK